MIRQHYRANPKGFKWGFIEASLETRGFFTAHDITSVFANHRIDSIRVRDQYLDINPGSFEKIRRAEYRGRDLHVPTDSYKREVLKRHTDAEHFLNLLFTLYDCKGLPDA